ncbi:gamma-glutamylcyclotransferase family protein [Streptomyces sp. NPDC087440]|uniref:gamma-glutamylcyclotransferase family protein n=1 Tax=Streptomyces sp. NPDC087440 TaxID=3365790 RepID=UPI0037F4D407
MADDLPDLPARPDTLFVYGTLRFPEVLRAVLGRVPAGAPALAPGWRAAALEHRAYPGLVASPGSTTRGVLLADLTVAEWRLLDAYEGAEYDLRRIALEGGTPYGWTYVWSGTAGVLPATWDAEAFHTHQLDTFLTLI